jgi:hypothetical protein
MWKSLDLKDVEIAGSQRRLPEEPCLPETGDAFKGRGF